MEISSITDTLSQLERHGFIKSRINGGLLYKLSGEKGQGQLSFTGNLKECYMIECDVFFKQEYMYGFHIEEGYIELSTISDSQLSYEQPDGNSTKILKGIGNHINLGEPGVICVPAETRLSYTSFVIRENVISGSQSSTNLDSDLLEPRNRVQLNRLPSCHRLDRILSDLIHCQMQEEVRALYYQAKAQEVLCLLAESLSNNRKKQPVINVQHRVAVEKARKILAQQMIEPPTTHELARAVGISATRLKQIFKQETGKTIFDYLKSIRMGAAISLMTDSGATITSVAHDVGYKSPSKFTSAFRRQYGVNPGKYLRMVRQRL